MSDLLDQLTEQSDRLVEEISPHLAHINPTVVGATLGELLSIYIAGHHPTLRAKTRRMLFELADALVPLMVERLIEGGRAPPEWREVIEESPDDEEDTSG